MQRLQLLIQAFSVFNHFSLLDEFSYFMERKTLLTSVIDAVYKLSCFQYLRHPLESFIKLGRRCEYLLAWLALTAFQRCFKSYHSIGDSQRFFNTLTCISFRISILKDVLDDWTKWTVLVSIVCNNRKSYVFQCECFVYCIHTADFNQNVLILSIIRHFTFITSFCS